MRTKNIELTQCKHCHCWILPELGAFSPGETAGRKGTKDDPRAPGDYDNICDVAGQLAQWIYAFLSGIEHAKAAAKNPAFA